MALFEPKRIDLTQINSGNRYNNGDRPNSESANAPIEASAYAQNIVDGFKASGTYSPTTIYKYPTIVNYQGSGYMCMHEDGITNILPTESIYWKKIVDKGDKGDTGAVAKVVQTLGTSVDDVLSQKAVTDNLDLKFDKSNVVQVTGQAIDKVMSQKAVTDNFQSQINANDIIFTNSAMLVNKLKAFYYNTDDTLKTTMPYSLGSVGTQETSDIYNIIGRPSASTSYQAVFCIPLGGVNYKIFKIFATPIVPDGTYSAQAEKTIVFTRDGAFYQSAWKN